MHETEAPKKTAVIAAVQLPNTGDDEHKGNIAELRRLLETLGYEVVGFVSQKRHGLGAGAIFGAGKLVELAAYTGGTGIVPSSAPNAGKKGKDAEDDEDEGDEGEGEAVDEADAAEDRADDRAIVAPPHPDGAYPHADVVVIDHEISPRQARNLEKATEAEVIDRTGVIVEIFHRHANTREARLQVEIARLSYVVPRLRAGVRGSDRQRGGIGGKGAGESSLELDRRKVRDRVAELKAELASIAREEDTRRSRRQGVRRVALVGYTNAGKSSLMRALTGSEVLVEDKLFATLGTTVRALNPEVVPRILVSDTVGFIKKLPHDLVASFRSTLEEAKEASLLLHVVDASDPEMRRQLEVTRTVLGEIGADQAPSRLILNKVDKVDEAGRAALAVEFPDAIQLSAKDPDDVGRLHEAIVGFFEADFDEVTLVVPYAQGALTGVIRQSVRVLAEKFEEDGTHLLVRAPRAEIARLQGLLDAN
ncbi:MAG: GTPase HflX [Deltaproteobacteria bacterium]|nr:GTPase HflX [Deltaproteobacteria bacterium]